MLIVAGVLVVYGVLAVMHGGTFWPFNFLQSSSIESSWTKVLVRDVSADHVRAVRWGKVPLNSLPGRPVGLADHGLNPERLIPYVEPSHTWTEERVAQLRALLKSALRSGRVLVLYRVHGSLDEKGVSVTCTPVAILRQETIVTAPKVRARDTS